MRGGEKPGNGASGKVGVILEDLHLTLEGLRHNGEHGSLFRAHQFGVGGHSSSMQLRSQFPALRASVTSRARKRQEAASGACLFTVLAGSDKMRNSLPPRATDRAGACRGNFSAN